ncbi:MAG: MATE family efflux transporter [Bacteroidetes bacterium]|nr:MAG: MATE family efflux transporter [Bacteroidota bacterium]
MVLDHRYRTILGVAFPLMISGFIQTFVFVTDASFLSRYSIVAYDASGNAGLLYLTFFLALMGMGDGIQILMARRVGENRLGELGRIFGTGTLTLLGIAGMVFSVLYFVVPDLLPTYSNNMEIAEAQIDFLSVRSYALFFAAISLGVQAFFYAIGKTWVILICAGLTAVSNVLLDYLLIFGFGEVQAMGVKGAALASCLADMIGMIFLLSMAAFSKTGKKYALFANFSWSVQSLKEFLKVGAPLFFQGFTALATWTVFFTWIEQMGTHELTVSQNIRAVYFLAFIPIGGFAGTTKTYISQYIGAGRADEIPLLKRRLTWLTVGCLAVFFHGAILYPEELIRWVNPNEAYMKDSANILRYVAGSIFLYAFVSVRMHMINGSGNTNITFLIELCCVSAYLLGAYLLIKVAKQEIYWVWSVEYIYFGVMGILALIYLKFFNWKKRKI